MKLRTLLIGTTFMAVLSMCGNAAAGDTTDYPVIAYATPSDPSMISLRAAPERWDFRTEASLYSSQVSTAKTEGGIFVEWRERVFRSLAQNMTPDVTGGERVVARIAAKESLNLAMEHFPSLERLIKALKLEVSTDMLSRGEEKDEKDEVLPVLPVTAKPQLAHQVVKDRFFMKTGLRIPIEKGRPALLSETSAVYGSITTYVSVRLDSKLDSSLGLRYAISRGMQVQVERTIADAVDPASGVTVQRAVSNMVKVVCVF